MRSSRPVLLCSSPVGANSVLTTAFRTGGNEPVVSRSSAYEARGPERRITATPALPMPEETANTVVAPASAVVRVADIDRTRRWTGATASALATITSRCHGSLVAAGMGRHAAIHSVRVEHH
eukprot:m.244939 g.244939  ORF g.244939 m.244939 type:complete len:122 (+) comp19044_c0_seq5:1263-1628(+)